MSEIRGKHVTVLGAARSGIAVAQLLARKGARVFLSEIAPLKDKREEAEVLTSTGIPFEFGGHTSRIMDADWWVVSPGICQSSSVLQKAKEKGIPVWGELEVSSWFCRAPIVGVTGSNGKSTVTALLGEVFRWAERPCVVAGNIGQPFSECVESAVVEGVAVLEVSSFQLETVQSFHPKVAVFLNLTPDHLDRHGCMDTYGRIKSRIFENQTDSDYLVFNVLDPKVAELARRARSQRVVFGMEEDSMGCGFLRQEVLTLRLQERDEEILSIHEMGIRGDHNVANALAVALTARLMGVDLQPIRQAFRTFRGLPHRMEFIRVVNGVEWVNDSKATNVDSVWYALGSFSSPIILIAGGRDKDADFGRLRERVGKEVRGIVLFGEAAEKMEKAFRGLQPLVKVPSLKNAVQKAREMAEPGDVVLLSPGCTSFDMFRNFEDRGEQFKALVGQL